MDRPIPLFVNLDGTLIKNDLSFEGMLALAKKRPGLLVAFAFWFLRGRGVLKARVTDLFDIDPEALPYRTELIDYLRQESAAGRDLHLVSAVDDRHVRKINDYLGLFRSARGSTTELRLAGDTRLDHILTMSDGKPFAYASHSRDDMPIWKRAAEAVVVDASPSVEATVGGLTSVIRTFPRAPFSLRETARALRLHQWQKNTLIFVPLFTSQRWRHPEAWQSCLIAFVCFGLVASASYVLNDLMDLAADRRHPSKRARPFANGRLSIPTGLVWSFGLLAFGLTAAFWLAVEFGAWTLSYFALTMAYSLLLKTYMLIDATVLAVLYTSRIMAGASVVGVEVSTWLLAFSIFLFFSLAMIKRCAELLRMSDLHRPAALGRDYRVTDLDSIRTMGIASGYLSVLVLALYADSAAARALYSNPKVLWLWCLLMLYWISRLWIKTARGEMHDDPLVYSAKDRATWLLAALMGVVMWLAL